MAVKRIKVFNTATFTVELLQANTRVFSHVKTKKAPPLPPHFVNVLFTSDDSYLYDMAHIVSQKNVFPAMHVCLEEKPTLKGP